MYEKGDKFREEIRRDHIEQFFSKRRKEFSETFIKKHANYDQQQSIQNLERQTIENDGIPTISVLQKLAITSQNTENIKLIGDSIFIDKLPIFLQLTYLGSKEQECTTWIYCNLLYLSQYFNKIVRKEFLITLFELMKNLKEEKVLESCMQMIFNIIHDGDSNLISLFLDNPNLDIVNLLCGIFISQNTENVLIQFLRCFYMLVKRIKSKKVQKLKKLKKYLLILIKQSTNNKIIALSLQGICEFFLYLPEEGNLAKTGMIKILTKLSFGLNSKNQTKKILRILAYSISNVEVEQAIEILLPFLQGTLQKYGNSDPMLNLNVYKILYDLLAKDKFIIQYFLKNFSPMFEIMMAEFESSVSVHVYTELSYIFCVLLFNDKNALMTNKGQIIFGRLLQIQKDGQLSQQSQKYIDNMIKLLKN